MSFSNEHGPLTVKGLIYPALYYRVKVYNGSILRPSLVAMKYTSELLVKLEGVAIDEVPRAQVVGVHEEREDLVNELEESVAR